MTSNFIIHFDNFKSKRTSSFLFLSISLSLSLSLSISISISYQYNDIQCIQFKHKTFQYNNTTINYYSCLGFALTYY